MRVIKSSAISKIVKKKSSKKDEKSGHKQAFSYNEESKTQKRAGVSSSGEDSETGSFNTKQILGEVKELRMKIRSLEDEKRELREENIKIKSDCSEQIRKAMNATGSDDQKVELLQHTVSELESKLDKQDLLSAKKDTEIDKLKRKIEDKELDILNMKNKRNEQQQKIVEAEEKVRQMAIEMKGFREQIGNYEQENASLKKEISTLNTSYNRMKEENKELSDMIDKLREQIESKRDSFKHSSGVDEEEFEEYKHATEALISDLKLQIKEFEKKNDELNNDLDKVHQEKEDSDNEFFKKLQDANRQIDMLQQSESSLKTSITQLEKKVEDLIQERLDKERTTMDVHSEVTGKYKALELKYNSVAAKLEDREKKLKLLESKITQLEEEKLYSMSNEEQKREEMLMDYKHEIRELNDKIANLENKNDQLLIEKDDLEQRLNMNSDRNFNSDGILEGNERLLSQIKKLQKEITQKDTQILELQLDVDKSSVGKKGKLGRQHTSRKDGDKERELAELSVENEFLKRQVEEMQEKISEIEKFGRSSSTSSIGDGYYGNIKEGHEDSGDLLKQLKVENNSLSSELIEIKTKYAESEQERNALQLKLRERNETLKKFSSEITKYEFEMVKAKQSLGEALNQNIELDQYNGELLEVIDKMKSSGKKKK